MFDHFSNDTAKLQEPANLMDPADIHAHCWDAAHFDVVIFYLPHAIIELMGVHLVEILIDEVVTIIEVRLLMFPAVLLKKFWSEGQGLAKGIQNIVDVLFRYLRDLAVN